VRVTVLIAVFDGGDLLHRAVESVLAQTYEDFELLIVDDASTDGAVARLPADPRIRIVRNERNRGQVPSLNRGLDEARGTYIARLDADDVMLPTRLERQVAVLDAEPSVALVGTWLEVVDGDGRHWSTLRGDVRSYADFVCAILTDRIPFGHPSLMYRLKDVRALGGYDETLAPSEDKDLYRRLALERKDARVVPEPLVVYLRHEGQLSQTQMRLQVENDHTGQERFLRSLAPALPARTIRLLLAGDAAYWDEQPLAELEPLLDGATARLRLDAEQRDAVARTIALRCARTLLGGWSSPTRPTTERAAAPAAFIRAHGAPLARAALTVLPLARAAHPLGAATTRARASARRGLRSESLAPLRARARRSRVLRRLYTKVAGFRLLDD
jgi:hypothetical protein